MIESKKTHAGYEGDRSGTGEPLLTDQWFVAMKKIPNNSKFNNPRSLSQQGLEMLHEEKIKFFPESWGSTYKNWLENIEDWCISRQLWWGHQIPAWFKCDRDQKPIHDGSVFVALNESDAKKQASCKGWDGPIVRDSDVLPGFHRH